MHPFANAAPFAYQYYPNPVTDRTTISLYISERGQVSMMVTDILGRILLKTDRVLDKGTHSFSLAPGNSGLVFFTAHWKGKVSSIKILHVDQGGSRAASLEYIGSTLETPQLKAEKAVRGGFTFTMGDKLLYIGYIDTLQSGILDALIESTTYTFQFATNIPCPGTLMVEYEGQVYNTIQIFSQCWLKENLNVGTRINGAVEQSDNGIIEKYCYDNKPDSFTKYGGAAFINGKK